MVPKLGSKFLHPRPEMTSKTSKSLCSNRSKEGKGFLPDKIGRTQILKTRVFRGEGQSQNARGKGDLQGYNENASIRMHFSILFFLHPKALIYTPF
jgi:hypothetical protein